MGDVVLALMRTMGSLRNGRIWVYVAAPAVVSLVLWIFLALRGLGVMVEWLLGHQPMTLLIAWGVAWLATLLAYMGAWMAIFACAYLTASLLAAIIVIPLLLKHLRAEGDLVVGDNEPYAVSDETDYTIPVHGEQRGLPLIEIPYEVPFIAVTERAFARLVNETASEVLVNADYAKQRTPASKWRSYPPPRPIDIAK